MKKTNSLSTILELIFLVVFNVLFFVLGGFKHNAIVWTSYGFIHFAYLMLLLAPVLIHRGKSSAVFGFSLYLISAIYFLVEFFIGMTFILASSPGSYIAELLAQLSPILRMFFAFADSYIAALRMLITFVNSFAAALSIQLSIAGLFVIVLILNLFANKHTADAEEERQHQIDYIKNASLELKLLMDSISDKETKKNIEKVYDAIYSSPVKPHFDLDLMEIENKILQSIKALKNFVSAENKETVNTLVNSLLSGINERNMRLKTLN